MENWILKLIGLAIRKHEIANKEIWGLKLSSDNKFFSSICNLLINKNQDLSIKVTKLHQIDIKIKY